MVFARSLAFDFIVDYDDTANLHEHESWRGLAADNLAWMATSYWQGHYHPLTWLTWAIDWSLWGLDPRGYHLQNVLWHVLGTWLCFALVRDLLVRCASVPRDGLLTNVAAAAGALFFAVHPLRAESVAWVTERRDVVSGAFLLAAVLAYLRAQDRRRPWWLLACFALTALSLLAKAWAITLPFVLLTLDVWPLRRSLRHPAVWLEKLPLFVLCACFAILALRAQAESKALQGFEHLPWLPRIGTAAYGFAFYPWVTLLPVNLIPMYDMAGDQKVVYTRFAMGGVLTLAGILLGITMRRRAPSVTCALMAYAILVAPVTGLAQSGPQAAADRYSYIPCLPFAALYAYGVLRWRALRVLAIPHLAALAIVGVMQVGLWRDAWTLWSATARRDPQNVRANLWLGQQEYLRYAELAERADAAGDPGQKRGFRTLADEHLVIARQRLRNAWLRNSKNPAVLHMRGVVLWVTGKPEEVRDANRLWRRAVALWPGDEHAEQARQMLANSKLRYPELFDDDQRPPGK